MMLHLLSHAAQHLTKSLLNQPAIFAPVPKMKEHDVANLLHGLSQ